MNSRIHFYSSVAAESFHLAQTALVPLTVSVTQLLQSLLLSRCQCDIMQLTSMIATSSAPIAVLQHFTKIYNESVDLSV